VADGHRYRSASTFDEPVSQGRRLEMTRALAWWIGGLEAVSGDLRVWGVPTLRPAGPLKLRIHCPGGGCEGSSRADRV
jgi:hypothetical protein